jgi:hypothetical protein
VTSRRHEIGEVLVLGYDDQVALFGDLQNVDVACGLEVQVTYVERTWKLSGDASHEARRKVLVK